MPSTLKDWFYLTFVGFVFLFPSLAWSDDVLECAHRGRLAASMVYAMSEGYELDKINVRFQAPPRNQKELDEQEAYVSAIKGEVAMLVKTKPPRDKEFAGKIGVRITEKCAIEYGAKHGNFKKIGSAAPNDAASSASIRCNNLRHDIMTIARAVHEGKPQQQLATFAQRSLPELGEERLALILTMIAEAYAHEGPIVEWMNKRYAGCAGDRV